MKTITNLVVFALIFNATLLQTLSAQTEYKIDSIQNFHWDESVMALQMDIRQHYTYDDEGADATHYLHMLKTNGVWVNNQQSNTTHNNLGLPLVRTTQSWDINTNYWINVSKDFYTYNGINAPETLVSQTWENNSMIWQYFVKYEYLYNDAQQQTKQITSFFDNFQDIWIPNTEFETVYDETGRALAYINRNYDTNSMQMINDTQTVNTIVGDVLTELLQQEWDISTDAWINTFKDEYVYNNDLLNQKNGFNWEESNWVPARQINYTYNGNDQIDTSTTLYYFDPVFENYSRLQFTYTNNHVSQWLFQSWDVDHWRNTQKWNDVYDANDNLVEKDTYTWDTTTDSWKDNTKTLNYYSEVIPFNLSASSNELSDTKIYPNPATDAINIKFKRPLKYSSQINLFDIRGKLIYKNVINPRSSKIKIPVKYQTNGIYVLHLKTVEATEIFKIVKNN